MADMGGAFAKEGSDYILGKIRMLFLIAIKSISFRNALGGCMHSMSTF